MTTYKILHLIGVMLLFLSLGGLTLAALRGGAAEAGEGEGKPAKPPGYGLAMAFHGVALVLILVTGFGYLARAKLGVPGWSHGKIVVWLLLGLAPMLIKRKPELAKALWFVLPLLGAAAAFLAVAKPGA